MLIPPCDYCHKEQTDLGAVFFGPPDNDMFCQKKEIHCCMDCWSNVIKIEPQPVTDRNQVEKEAPEWKCSNCNYIHDINMQYVFCGMCGTPRPTEPTMKERLAKVLASLKYDNNDNRWLTVASAAIKFLEETQQKLTAKEDIF